jgi:hypothetical protein
MGVCSLDAGEDTVMIKFHKDMMVNHVGSDFKVNKNM